MIWGGWNGEDSEIFTWTAAGGGIVQVTSNDYDEWGQQISGSRAVWVGFDQLGFDQEIFTWTPTGGVVQLTDDEVYESNPQIYGTYAVWEGYDQATSSYQIYGWHVYGGVMMLSDPAGHGDLGSPQISATRAIWSCNFHGNLQTWTTTGGLIDIDTGGIRCNAPVVSGDLMAWSGYDAVDGDYEIYVATHAELAVEDVDPAYGPSSGGNEVTLVGDGFTDASAVTFGANAATSFAVVSDNEISAVAPAGVAGVVDIRVTSPLGLSPNTDRRRLHLLRVGAHGHRRGSRKGPRYRRSERGDNR